MSIGGSEPRVPQLVIEGRGVPVSPKRGQGSAGKGPVEGDLRERLELLKTSRVLAGLDDAVLADLAAGAAVVDLQPGESLFRKGDASDSMYVIAKGCVRIHDGDYTFTQLEPPASFGEYALVQESSRTASATASATACERTTLLRIDRALFQRQLRDNCGFLYGLLQCMLNRIVEKDFTEEQIDWNREEIRRQRDQIASQRDEVEKQGRLLAQMNAVKDKFFAIVAHDLTSPLASLSMMTRALSERPAYLTPEKAQEYARMIHESATMACRLMENLWDWSRSQTNTLEFKVERVNLHGAVRDSFALLDVCAQHKRIALRNEVPEDLWALADARSVSAIVRNLVSNAVKYTGEGGRVTVSATQAGGRVEWTVADTGVGIEAERLDGILRLDAGTSTRGTAGERGTGLGLKLCREFVEKMHGDIRVTSQAGRGTTFTVALPMA
jgi:two-component system, sensor histidine kinase and response regulator